MTYTPQELHLLDAAAELSSLADRIYMKCDLLTADQLRADLSSLGAARERLGALCTVAEINCEVDRAAPPWVLTGTAFTLASLAVKEAANFAPPELAPTI